MKQFHRPEFQKTLACAIDVGGIGIHSGQYIEATLHPAPENHGIVFCRSDSNARNTMIPATIKYAVQRNLCTRIENEEGVGVNTIEHFMATFHGLGIDNVLVEIDGPEMPILDGSAIQIINLVRSAGIIEQNITKSVMVITKDIEMDMGDGVTARLSPADELEIDLGIEFDDQLIGAQTISYRNQFNAFETQLADARTFCMLKDVEAMRNSGLARGGSLDNAIVVHEGTVLNADGLRSDDEFVRHKALDCLGDLYLLGMAIRAKLTIRKPGHALSINLLKALMATPDAFYIENLPEPEKSGQWAYPDAAVAAHS